MLLLWIWTDCGMDSDEEYAFNRRDKRIKDDSQHFSQRKNGVVTNLCVILEIKESLVLG